MLDLYNDLRTSVDKKNFEKIMDKFGERLSTKSLKEDQLLDSILIDCTNLTQEQLDNTEFLVGIDIFNQLYIKSTTVEKKPELPSDILSSSDMQTTQETKSQKQ